VADAHAHPASQPAPDWDDETLVGMTAPDTSSAHLLWESKSASISTGGTTRSLTPHVQAQQPRRRFAIGIALAVSVLTIVGFASSRHHVTAVAASSARPARFLPEHKPSSGPTTAPMNTTVERPPASASATAAIPAPILVPIVQLDELPAAASVAPPRSAGPAANHASVRATHSEPPVAAPVNCDLPYRIDASGVRRVRFECL
jgi:hypothetical protein